MLLQANMPVPKDVPLPLPLPEGLLVALLVVSFLLHIVFINLMVGGSIVALWAQIKGLKDKRFDEFAHEVGKTITVNKSLAVVLGVAPLLSINALYTVYFYSANALTGYAWIMIIPLVIIAFLLTYLHKYTWKALENSKRLHIGIMAIAVAIFLFIPLIFLTNVNLMMFPEKWGVVKGFFSALMLPNVWPRYLEFIGASVGVTGVFLVWYSGRKNYPVETIYNGTFSRYELKKLGFSIAAVGLSLQVLFGVIVLFTLPSKGMGFDVIGIMGVAGLLLVTALWYTYQSIIGEPEKIDVHFKKIVVAMLVFMVAYGGSRQLYRHKSLDKHQQLMAARTEAFEKRSKEVRENPVEEEQVLEIDPSLGDVAQGAAIFKQNCGACHQKDKKLVGPPMTEMAAIYADNEEGLKNWIKAPGKKRPDFPQMPGFPQLSDNDLQEVSNYILSIQ
ncbi:MAG: cytochrome C [Crocinitomicaceae bacterium]|nr:cytochrome C [Crocinitomicaceae bacterium]|tara:strand:- start:2814 stop:4148 length:1335 start_codon:yes stop_codon:yes gene_type:complete